MGDSKEPCLGLIGGLGVGATIYYYQELARARTPLRLLMAHADVQQVLQHVRDGEHEQLAAYFADLIGRMAAGGATFAAIPAVTPHVCLPYLAPRSPLPLVSIVDPTAREIRARGLRRVALFGSRFVVESGLFGMLGEVEIVKPRAHEIEAIHRLYFELVTAGRGDRRQRDGLTAIAETILEREAVDAIVLAGTELALVFDQGTDFPAVDSTRLHLDAILREL